MTVKKKQIIECDVIDVAFGGKGLAKIDGFAVFIDQTVTGDRVAARIIRKKRNYAEAVVQELLTPSPLRVDPPCPYSGFCGGCKWQFIDYPHQLELKRRHVAESLEHIALMGGGTPVHPTLPSDTSFRVPQQNGVFLLGPALADAPGNGQRCGCQLRTGTACARHLSQGVGYPGMPAAAGGGKPHFGCRAHLHAGLGPAGLRASQP